jgi:hypothetical protein
MLMPSPDTWWALLGRGVGWMLRQGNAPVVVLVEEPDRAPSVPADGQSFGREATKLAGRFQNFAGDRGVGATAKSDNKKIAAGREAAAA